MAKLTWHGHACFTLVTGGGERIIFDPWLNENPKSDMTVDQVGDLDFILATHGHYDHFADAIELAKKTGATLASTFEIVSFAQGQGVENTHPMHIGGGYRFSFGYTKMTPALHGGQVHGDTEGAFSTVPGGFLLELPEGRLYHAGDTALLMEMHLLKGKVDVALLPIGDNFTMGPEDAAKAVEFIEPKTVIPMHYDTFDVIEQDPHDFVRRVGDHAEVVVLEPGESYEF